MRGLDETDREILRALLEDSRRPYSDIAEAVDLSPPAVSDRVERLQELGVIRQFTVDLDRSLLRDAPSVLVTIRARPGSGAQVRDALVGTEPVEHLFVMADEQVVCTVVAEDVRGFLATTLPADAVESYRVTPLAEHRWMPRLGQADLAPECVECGNRVGSGGERERLGGTLYHFCCSSCQDAFVTTYEQLSEEQS